jgi:predicted RNA binding protein YcfA (HicA-like mRNA interferase family)
MTRLPRPTGSELLAALRRRGFEVARVRGSHHFVAHPDGRRTVVPVHAGETIGPGLLAKILRDLDVSREDLTESLAGR